MSKLKTAKTHTETKTIQSSQDAVIVNTESLVSELIQARKSQKVTQSQLCKESGVAQKTISRLETGIEKPNLKTLLKLTDNLGLRIVFEEI